MGSDTHLLHKEIMGFYGIYKPDHRYFIYFTAQAQFRTWRNLLKVEE